MPSRRDLIRMTPEEVRAYLGAQRRIVRAVLARSPLVEEFRDAPPERGGWGATVVRLRAGAAVG